jgi:alanine racemase
VQTPFTPDTQRAWVDVDLDAIVRNARSYQHRVGVPILAMVKADGYGLGAIAVARALAGEGVWGFGVATPEEARALHLSGIVSPILVVSPYHPAQDGALRQVAARPTIGSLEGLEAWIVSGGGAFHLEIDTGMRRTGLPWGDEPLLRRVGHLIRDRDDVEGIFTHFHSAGHDHAACTEQWQRLHRAIEGIGRRPALIHAANSAAGAWGAAFAGDLARPGIHLFGGAVPGLDAVPVAAMRARVIAVRRVASGDAVGYDATWRAPHPTTIATLGAGYADGVPRALSNVGAVELLGQRLRLVGRVSMDSCGVDAGDLPVAIGDVATIFGGRVTVDEQAALAGTISYELLTGLGPRLPRRYLVTP